MAILRRSNSAFSDILSPFLCTWRGNAYKYSIGQGEKKDKHWIFAGRCEKGGKTILLGTQFYNDCISLSDKSFDELVHMRSEKYPWLDFLIKEVAEARKENKSGATCLEHR
nr:MAG TPA: hypothetical protein [Caudoviricetes sp.]